MTDPKHQQLLGHLLGALDNDEHQALDARLEQDPEFCRELTAWRRRLAPLEAVRPDFEPRPGLAQRTCRLVVAYASSAANSGFAAAHRRMSPHPVPPSRVAQVGWFDMAAVAVLLFAAVALVVPAIQNSRFQARLASCQNGLRQFGLALTQYGNYQRSGLAQLANNETLTSAGLVAVSRIKDVYSTDNHRAVCPDAWLATQGTLCETRRVGTRLASLCVPLNGPLDVPLRAMVTGAVPIRTNPMGVASGEVPAPISSQALRAADNRCEDWSGAWRSGTTDGLRFPPSPADMPLLADAPSADVPGQNLASHGGRGRNVFYADGRTGFLSRSASGDPTDGFLSGGAASSASTISAPIIFVGAR
jgi:prepilin-type processing-associated H-X9-DG protein